MPQQQQGASSGAPRDAPPLRYFGGGGCWRPPPPPGWCAPFPFVYSLPPPPPGPAGSMPRGAVLMVVGYPCVAVATISGGPSAGGAPYGIGTHGNATPAVGATAGCCGGGQAAKC